jgi:WD40 repeat protein
VWNATTFENVHTLTCNSDVRELLIDGNYLYSGCGTGTIQVREQVTVKYIFCFVLDLQTDHISDSREEQVWDLATFNCIQSVKKHSDDVLTMQIAGDRYSQSLFFPFSSFLHTFFNYSMPITGVCVCVCFVFFVFDLWYRLFSGSSDSTIKVWDINAGDDGDEDSDDVCREDGKNTLFIVNLCPIRSRIHT